jgi:hypothetical protein
MNSVKISIQPSKENIQHFKHKISLLFSISWVMVKKNYNAENFVITDTKKLKCFESES